VRSMAAAGGLLNRGRGFLCARAHSLVPANTLPPPPFPLLQAIREFAEALLVIPRTLAVNAAQDATELVAKLCAFHHQAQASEDKADQRFFGLDLIKGKVVHNLKAGVVEPALSKVKSIKFATEAAVTILRIDDFIRISAPQGSGGR
jgi:T-complex protein 1 subunit alpha